MLADLGTDLISQRTNAVERFAVIKFRWFLANSCLQSDVVDSVDFLPFPTLFRSFEVSLFAEK
jgi:hypothetical protein